VSDAHCARANSLHLTLVLFDRILGNVVLIWIAAIAAVALLLLVGIERLLKRFNIRPERPEERSGGFRDVLERVEQWQRDHERGRK
jgi:hypothetical protein